MTDFPRTASALRTILDAHGVRTRRSHGQNFLTDPQAVDAIVRDANVTPDDHVVEVGTGIGLLTHVLAETGAEVSTFEIDEAMLELAQDLRVWPDRVRFHLGDALAGKHALAPPLREAFARRPPDPGRVLFVSNLPYGPGTPILLDALALPRPPDEIVVMLQREVVEKLLAPPGSRVYGAPSVQVGLKADGTILRRFGPEVFWPRPRVKSAVVRLVPRTEVPLAADEHVPFGAFVTALFSLRRKVLPRALRRAVADLDPERASALVVAAGLGPMERVENVSPEQLLALWRASTA